MYILLEGITELLGSHYVGSKVIVSDRWLGEAISNRGKRAEDLWTAEDGQSHGSQVVISYGLVIM